MADLFEAKRFDISTINGGYEYINGDTVSSQEFNSIVEGVLRTQNYAESNKKDVSSLYAIVDSGSLVAKNEVEDIYLTRKTGGTLSVVDGALTRVEKIGGDTVGVNGVLYSSSFKGIKSRGKNLVNFDDFVGDALVKNADGTYTFTKNGSNRFSKTAEIIIPYTESIVDTSGRTRLTSAYDTILDTTKSGICWVAVLIDGSNSYGGGKSPNISGVPMTIIRLRLYLQATEADGASITFKNYQIEYGNGTNYETYKVDNSFYINNSVTLDKWDYIDVERKKLVRQTGTKVYSASDFNNSTIVNSTSTLRMWTIPQPTDFYYYTASGADMTEQTASIVADRLISGVNGNNSGYIYSGVTTSGTFCVNTSSEITTVDQLKTELSGLTIKYKLATPTETDIDIPDSYIAYLNGVEAIDDTGRTYTDTMVANNTAPKPTITQTYYTKV